MDNNSPDSGTLYLLFKDDEFEDEADKETSVQLLEGNARTYVWSMSQELVGNQIGIAGQAASLFERYLARRMKQLPVMQIDSSQWRRVKQDILKQLPLYIAVCIQIVVKMHSSSGLNNTLLRRSLLKQNIRYTFGEICAAELEVYKALDYRIPTWTNVQKAELLAIKLGMKGYIYESVAYVMDIAELHRDDVQAHVHKYAMKCAARDTTGSPGENLSIGTLHDLHLAAGAVAAAAIFMRHSDPLPTLATLTRSSKLFIKCIADFINTSLLTKHVGKRSSESPEMIVKKMRNF